VKHFGKRALSLGLALALALTLLPAALAAQDDTQRGVLTYTQAIAPQYDDATSFSGSLAAVKKDGKWGYIDTDGNVVIPFQYDVAYAFNEGYAVVGIAIDSYEEDDYDWETDEYLGVVKYNVCQMGFIDETGKLTYFIADSVYDRAAGDYLQNSPLRMDFSETSNDQKGSLVFYNGYICLPNEDNYFLFDTTGKPVTVGESSYGALPGYQVTEGVIITGYWDWAGTQAYFDMTTGQSFSVAEQNPEDEDSWVELRPFNQGLAPVAQCTTDWETGQITGLWGFVDRTGNWVIQPAYSDFMVSGMYTTYKVFGQTGLAMVQDTNGKWGAIDKTGKTVIPFQYDNLYPYYFGLAAFSQNGKWGYLDDKGNVAIPAQYVITSGFSSNGYAVAYDGQKAFLIDAKGNAIPGADTLDPDTYFSYNDNDVPTVYTPGSYVVIQENGKYGYGHVEYTPNLPDESQMDAWAYAEVTAAIEEDLVPTYLQNLYLNNITRDEFCDLVIQAIEQVLDQDIEDVVKAQTGKDLSSFRKAYPFADTTSSNVIAANALGIVNGRGGSLFDPYATITRQEAAAFLMRSAKVLGMDTDSVAVAGFTDSGDVGVWFTDAVNFVYQINVMGGTGNNSFSPLGTYTREQSYMTIYRLFQAVVGQDA
jgi:hypothetical protein